MALVTAIKAFLKAFKDPEKGKQFIEEKEIVRERSHLQLLSQLQDSGRLIDFLKEDISGFNDAQIGAAVRQIHENCGQMIEEFVTVRPVLEEKEGMKVDVPLGYDPMKIKVVGKVKGNPPYSGKLVHKGWRAHKISLPNRVGNFKEEIIAPAEVEV